MYITWPIKRLSNKFCFLFFFLNIRYLWILPNFWYSAIYLIIFLWEYFELNFSSVNRFCQDHSHLIFDYVPLLHNCQFPFNLFYTLLYFNNYPGIFCCKVTYKIIYCDYCFISVNTYIERLNEESIHFICTIKSLHRSNMTHIFNLNVYFKVTLQPSFPKLKVSQSKIKQFSARARRIFSIFVHFLTD